MVLVLSCSCVEFKEGCIPLLVSATVTDSFFAVTSNSLVESKGHSVGSFNEMYHLFTAFLFLKHSSL